MQSQLPPNRLRELREARGLKAIDLAYVCRVDPVTVRRWEDGLIPQQHLPALAEKLHCSVPFLAGWSDHDNGDSMAAAS